MNDNGVYNGKYKLFVQNNLMSQQDVRECMQTLKNKRSEGVDRIPVCCLFDARVTLIDPMAMLFG